MITDLTYVSYDEALARPKSRREHYDQCLYLVADAERTLEQRKKELVRAEELYNFRVEGF